MKASRFLPILLAGAAALLLLGWWAARETGGIARLGPSGDQAPGGVQDAANPSLTVLPGPGSSLETLPDSGEGARSAVRSEGIVGRVLEEGSELPLAGFWAQMNCGAQVVGEASSDSRGAFFLPLPPSDACSVSVEAEYGWRMVDSRCELGEPQPGTLVELAFHARRANSSIVQGLLIDEDSGEGVPFYDVVVQRSATNSEVATSDEHGRFATQTEFEEGPITIQCVDRLASSARVSANRIEHLGKAKEDEPRIPILVGPTYHLALPLPGGVSLKTLSGVLCDWDEPSYGTHTEQSRTPVREGNVPWLRFMPLSHWPGKQSRAWCLSVQSGDGYWGGEARVDSVRGIYPGIVRIVLEARGGIEGRISERSGGLACPVALWLTTLEEGSAPEGMRSRQLKGDGRFDFSNLRGGRWRLEARSNLHRPKVAEVLVTPGRTVACDMVLEREPTAGTIHGRVVSARERPRADLNVVLNSLRPSDRFFNQPLRFQSEGGRSTASFEFHDVPNGDYVLFVNGRDPWTGSPASLNVTPPARDLEFVESEGARRPSFRVLDAESGALLDPYSVCGWSPTGGLLDISVRVSTTDLPLLVPRDESIRWIVGAEGHVPAFFEPGAIDPQRSAPIEVRLARGWGAEFTVLGPGFAPLKGAQVLVDGGVAGETDDHGVLRVMAGTRPEQVEVRYLDWEPEYGSGQAWKRKLLFAPLRWVVFFSPPD